MLEASRIRWNSLFSFLTISIRLVANVLLFLLIARYYGAEIFGQFTFAHTLATILILFADFGFDVLLTIEVAKSRDKAGRIFQTFFSYKFLFSIAALIIMWGISFLGEISPEAQQLVMIFSFYVVFTALTNFIFALFKGIEKLQYETRVSFIINFGLLVLTILLAILNADIVLIAVIFVASRFVGFVIALIYSIKLIPEISFKPIYTGWRSQKKIILVFGFHLLFGNLFFQLDTILLAFWKGDIEVGIYQSVFKLVMLPLIIPEIFISALMPVLSRLFNQNKVTWEKLGSLLNKILILIALPITLFLFIYSDQIINFIYSKSEFSDAIPILKIFAFILLIRLSVETYALMLTTSGKQKFRMIVVIFATFLNFGMNYFMIPEYGPFGAAITSLITNIAVGLGYIIFTYPLVIKWIFKLKLLYGISIILIPAVILWQINEYSFWITMPVVAVYYSVLVWKIVLTKEEKEILFEGKLGFSNISSSIRNGYNKRTLR